MMAVMRSVESSGIDILTVHATDVFWDFRSNFDCLHSFGSLLGPCLDCRSGFCRLCCWRCRLHDGDDGHDCDKVRGAFEMMTRFWFLCLTEGQKKCFLWMCEEMEVEKNRQLQDGPQETNATDDGPTCDGSKQIVGIWLQRLQFGSISGPSWSHRLPTVSFQ